MAKLCVFLADGRHHPSGELWGRNSVFSGKQGPPVLQSCGCDLSGGPHVPGGLPAARRSGATGSSPGGHRGGTRCSLCETRTDGRWKAECLSQGELDPVPKPREHFALAFCGIAALAWGGEHCASGLLRTDDMSAGTEGGQPVPFAFGSTCCEKEKKKYFSAVLDFPCLISPQTPGMLGPCRRWEGGLILEYRKEAALARELAGSCQTVKAEEQVLNIWWLGLRYPLNSSTRQDVGVSWSSHLLWLLLVMCSTHRQNNPHEDQ